MSAVTDQEDPSASRQRNHHVLPPPTIEEKTEASEARRTEGTTVTEARRRCDCELVKTVTERMGERVGLLEVIFGPRWLGRNVWAAYKEELCF
ncbi:hypothetical protein Droror1_Dr00020903 [Drosera rotundifolia]